MNKNYEVYYFTPDNPQHLEQWLDGILRESSLRLLATSGNYWIFEQTLLLDESAKVESFAVEAMESYGGFYDKAVIALGFSSASLPSEEMDNKMLKKISDLFRGETAAYIKGLERAVEIAKETTGESHVTMKYEIINALESTIQEAQE